MELPKTYNPQEVEDKIYKLWQKSGFFNPDKLPPRHKKPYCIVIPPPNITGELHMGHALNTVVQDILIRWRRLQGFKALWVPGTDHAGIATQNAVEKTLRKEGKNRFDLGREKFVERVWEWKEKYGNIILDQFKKMGASLDWSRTHFTLNKDYTLSVQTAFLRYFKKGWIYRGERVINWCPRCQTSLSDLELEHKEEKGHLWYIKYLLKPKTYNLKPKTYIVVATTRPETMLGDTAVAVNPNDKRYKDLVGKKVILPLVNKEIPVIADRSVDPEFGTGAVKITPAHDLTDYEIKLKHGLDIVQVIDKNEKITKSAPFSYQGLKTLDARKMIVEDLKKIELLEKVEDYSHQVPRCYRCQTLIELIPSQQWFLKMKTLAKLAEMTVKEGRIKFRPKRWEKVYFDWLKNIKDWCISRQLWWGHKIPLKDETDVLDTWFSSALWPFAALGWPIACAQNQKYCKPKKNSDLAKFYPTDVLSTDRGIINLWVARMIFSGMEFMKKIPFKEVYIHPTVLTGEGQRMSKSLGTGVDPIVLIKKYGADAVRFGITYQITELQDIKFSENNIIMGRKFCNKIWNASRFVLLQIGNSKFKYRNSKQIQNLKFQTAADKRILKALDKTIKSVNKDLENFRFGKASHSLYNFFWHDFCDKYIELAKSKIQSPKSKTEKENTQKILLYVLLTSLKLLHPFIPFVTEEIYQKLPLKNKKKCLMVEKWPSAG